MAYAQVIAGFEGASPAGWTVSAATVETAAKRSGSYGLKTAPSGASAMGRMSIDQSITMGSPPGEVFGVYHEVFFKINSLPTVANTPIGQFGAGSTPGIQLEVNTDGTWRIDVTGIGIVSGGSALPTGVWLRLIAKHWSFPAAGQDQFGTQASPTHAQKARLEIDSEDGLTNYGRLSTTGANLSVFGLDGPICGARAPNTGTFDIYWDDAKCLVATNITDVYVVTKWLVGGAGSIHKLNNDGTIFTHSRVQQFLVGSQGGSDDFSPAGGFADVDEVPKGAGSVSSSTLDATTTYRATAMVTGQVAEAITLRANAAGAGVTHALMLDGVEYAKTLLSTSDDDNQNTPLASVVYFTPITKAVFNALQFGVRVKTGGSTLTLENLFLEVVGPNAPAQESVFDPDAISQIGLTWVEFTDSADALKVWANVALPDPATYFGGYKEPRVVEWGSIRRGLSDVNGTYEGTAWSWILNDTDRTIRALLAGDLTKWFVNRSVTGRAITDTLRRALALPRTIFRGVVRDFKPLPDGLFSFDAEDYLVTTFQLGSDELQIPRRTVTLTDFANADADIVDDAGVVQGTVGSVGKPVPIIYGQLSDRELATQTTFVNASGSALLVDTSIDRAQQVQMNALVSIPGTFLKDERVHTTMTNIKSGKEGPHGNYSGNTNSGYADGSGLNGSFAGSWDRVDGVDGYRLYMFPSWVTFDPQNPVNDAPGKIRFRFHDNNAATQDGFFGKKYGMVFSGWTDPNWADFFATPATATPVTVTIDNGKGLCPYVYCGRETVDGVTVHAFLLAGHALKSIEEIYVNGVRVDIQTARGPWKVPGYDGRPKFEVRNGRRYCVVYGIAGFEGPDTGAGLLPAAVGTIGLAFNVQGIEDVGDGTGVLMTSMIDQYLHALQNWLIGDYQNGAWLATPVFPDDATLLQIDEESFATAKTTSVERLSGGYVGAVHFGLDTQISVREAIARLNICCDVNCGFNLKTQLMISMLSESITLLGTSNTVTQIRDILKGTFHVDPLIAEFFNRIPYQYWFRVQTNEWKETTSVKDATSITKTKETRSSQMRSLWFVYDSAIAADIAQRFLLRSKEVPRRAVWQMGMAGLNFELGNVILLTHVDGIGANGYVATPMRVFRQDYDPQQYVVSIEAYDVGQFFSDAFILGNEAVLPASWLTATAAQRKYGFLADEATSLFSDGARGKRLR